MKRMEEIGCDGNWGVFSMTIPGRVGYQCSNYYRQLIKEEKVKDDNYYFDDKGKLRYKRGANKDATTGSKRKPPAGSKSKAKRRKRAEEIPDSEEDDDEVEGEGEGGKSPRKPKSKAKKSGDKESEDLDSDEEDRRRYDNPLPGFVDPITLDEVVRPAISPYGHVMSYKSWVRCLSGEPKNICPITKQPLTKRQLVILDFDNIHQFRAVMQAVPL